MRKLIKWLKSVIISLFKEKPTDSSSNNNNVQFEPDSVVSEEIVEENKDNGAEDEIFDLIATPYVAMNPKFLDPIKKKETLD